MFNVKHFVLTMVGSVGFFGGLMLLTVEPHQGLGAGMIVVGLICFGLRIGTD